MSQAESAKSERPGRSLPEWITFGIATSILTVVIGLVIYLWLGKQHQQPPDISVSKTEPMRESSGQFYVPFTVTNTGGETAESVQIIAELEIRGEVEESGEQQIDFLSGSETQAGAFVFSRDPTQGKLTLRVASYKLP